MVAELEMESIFLLMLRVVSGSVDIFRRGYGLWRMEMGQMHRLDLQ